jgi:hypothetical protein
MKRAAFALLVLVLSASPGWASGLTLTIRDGMVTLDAQDVTVRQILAEWARVGKTRIINLEGVTSGTITLKLDNVPEQTALDIILRSVPGYVAASRPTYVADSSRYDRIVIMPTTTAVAARPPQSPPGQAFQGTQLRGSGASLLTPGALPDGAPFAPPFNPAADQVDDDPALAAAAAAGLIAMPATSPGPAAITPPGFGMSAPGSRQPAQTTPTPTAAAPSNPFNVAPGTALPSLAPPPPPPGATPPPTPLRPPQPDR